MRRNQTTSEALAQPPVRLGQRPPPSLGDGSFTLRKPSTISG